MAIIVTGAAGFIGANIVKALNDRGHRDVIGVDNLTQADKFKNLIDCELIDYFDKQEFIRLVAQDALDVSVDAVLHQGACSDTMATDGRYVMENNYRYSATLLDYCHQRDIPFIYASSAAVYGASKEFREERELEAPLNVYGFSKFLFDQHVRSRWSELDSQVVGLRYFNVYGPRETHKGRMASVAFHCFNQFLAEGFVKLFEGSGGYAQGEQVRDFVSVEDIVKINLFFLDHPEISGIFNAGTGRGQTFNEVAVTVVNTLRAMDGQPQLSREQMVAEGLVRYVPFHEGLKAKYQSYTQADIAKLKDAGYPEDALTVQQGVARYVNWLAGRSR